MFRRFLVAQLIRSLLRASFCSFRGWRNTTVTIGITASCLTCVRVLIRVVGCFQSLEVRDVEELTKELLDSKMV